MNTEQRERAIRIGDPLPAISLRAGSGEPVDLHRWRGRPLLLVCVRYYGWIPCLDYLAQVRKAHSEIEALGARVVAVGTGADFQARRLMEEGSPFPCLVDADASLYRTLGVGRVGLRMAFDRSTYANYWRAWRRGARQGRITGDPRRLSGVAIVDAAGRLCWRHVARTVGDYPPVARVLDVLRRLPGPVRPLE